MGRLCEILDKFYTFSQFFLSEKETVCYPIYIIFPGRDEIERLIAGEAIEKMVRLELTYDEIDNSIDNLWSVLFTTGYLTQAGQNEQGAYRLVIPNKEIREVYRFQIQEWFQRSVLENTEQLTGLCGQMWKPVRVLLIS